MKDMVINHWAVLACALLNLVLGAIWYSPALFYNGWKEANKLSDEEIKKVNPLEIHGISFILAYLISYNLAFFLGDTKTDLMWGLTAGFLAGFGWSAAIFTIIALYEQKSLKYILINGGYIIIYFSLIGIVLGFWR